MQSKLLYYTKLTCIMILSTLLLALGETPMREPIWLILLATGYIVCIRFLWVSALRDERIMKTRELILHKRKEQYQQKEKKQAA